MSISLTAHTIENLPYDRANEAAELGAAFGRQIRCRDPRLAAAWDAAFEVQQAIGLAGITRQLLTMKRGNHKLQLTKRNIAGLTLFHHMLRTTKIVDNRRLVVNACPFAGDCTRLCVINNNRGRLDTTRQGWQWRTEFMVRYPYEFFLILSFSIARALRDGPLLFRPNINSDVEWEILAPALFDGTIFGSDVLFYGYTKVPIWRQPNGWLTPKYRVAFSANEHHPINSDLCRLVLDHAGVVAVVTDRTYNACVKQPIKQWHPRYPVVDGDVSDEWILDSNGVIGDLAFKPDNLKIKAFGMTSPFVHKCYQEAA